MPDKKYLKERGRVWWFQLAVPLHLQGKLGKAGKPLRLVAESLGTSDLRVAQRKRTERLAAWRRVFDAAEGAGPLDPAAVRNAAEVELRAAYDRLAADYLTVRPKLPEMAAELQSNLAPYMKGLEDFMGSPLPGPSIGEQAIETLRQLGVEVTPERIATMARGFLEAHTAAVEMVQQGKSPPPLPAPTGSGVKLDAHLEAWLAQSNVAPKAKVLRRADVVRFAAEFPTTAAVTRKGVQQWIEKLAAGGKAPGTIRRILSHLRGYWEYLGSHDVVAETNRPFERLTIPKSAKKGNGERERKPFDPADVVRLLQAADAKGDRQLVSLIAMAMYSGARIEELASLKVENVDEQAFKIVDSKTQAGVREVPIHSQLKATMAKLVKDSRDGYVITGLKEDQFGHRGDTIGKRFSTLKTSLRFGEAYNFHSIRRTVAQLLKNAAVPEFIAADLLGHRIGTMSYGVYAKGVSLAVKREAIEKLQYPGL